MKKQVVASLGASAAFALVLVGSPASADTVTIGLQETGTNGGAITTEATGSGSAMISNIAYGTFSSVSVDGTGNPPLVGNAVLLSNTINTSTTGTGTLNIFVTTQGNTSPTGAINFLSSFTENLITSGWTLTEKTFVDAGNGLFALTTPLSSNTFTAGGFVLANFLANVGAGPWSLTEEYIVTAVGAGNSNSTINASISPVPIPGALPLFASGLLGLHFLARRRKRKHSVMAIG